MLEVAGGEGPALAPPGPAVRAAAIASVASALPATAVPNAPIAARLGVDDHWIVKRLGIHERRVATEGERLEDLVTEASELALERAGIDGRDVDLVLVGTMTQDELLPNTAPLVAQRIGAERAGAIDLGAACMGFLVSVAMGAGQIESRRAEVVLAIGADLLTRFVDNDDRRTAALIGDGAAAAVLTPARGTSVLGPCLLRSSQTSRESVFMTREERKLRMDGHDAYKAAIAHISAVTEEVLAEAGLGLDDIDVFVFHQSNARILQGVIRKLGLPPERCISCIDRIGNTSGASVGLALDHAREEGRLVPGARLLMGSIGAGYMWGAMVLEWGGDEG